MPRKRSLGVPCVLVPSGFVSAAEERVLGSPQRVFTDCLIEGWCCLGCFCQGTHFRFSRPLLVVPVSPTTRRETRFLGWLAVCSFNTLISIGTVCLSACFCTSQLCFLILPFTLSFIWPCIGFSSQLSLNRSLKCTQHGRIAGQTSRAWGIGPQRVLVAKEGPPRPEAAAAAAVGAEHQSVQGEA